MMANTMSRTKSCPHCGHRARTNQVAVLYRARTAQEALAAIQHLKEREQGGGAATFKRFRPSRSKGL